MKDGPRIDAVRAELQRAIARAGTLYARLPAPELVDVSDPSWRELDSDLDAALAGDDVGAANAAIARWRRHAEQRLGRAA